MDLVHLVFEQGPLCHAVDARWCTVLRESVSCPECQRLMALRLLRERDRAEPAPPAGAVRAG